MECFRYFSPDTYVCLVTAHPPVLWGWTGQIGFVTAVQMNEIKIFILYTVALAYAAGTGTGYSVLDMVAAMKKASGKDVGALLHLSLGSQIRLSVKWVRDIGAACDPLLRRVVWLSPSRRARCAVYVCSRRRTIRYHAADFRPTFFFSCGDTFARLISLPPAPGVADCSFAERFRTRLALPGWEIWRACTPTQARRWRSWSGRPSSA